MQKAWDEFYSAGFYARVPSVTIGSQCLLLMDGFAASL